jgi:hypothetical protein
LLKSQFQDSDKSQPDSFGDNKFAALSSPKGEEVIEKEIKIAVAKGIEVLLSTHMPSFQNLSR